MPKEQSQPGEPTAGGRRTRRQWNRRLWPVIFAVVAFGLWIQWLGPGLFAELRSEDGSQSVVVLQLLPLIAGAVAMIWQHPAGRLALFPLSFIPGLALLAETEVQALTTTGSLSLALGTFVLYLVVAAGRPSEMPQELEEAREPIEQASGDPHSEAFQRFVAVRFIAVGVVFLGVTYALFVDDSIQSSLAGLEGEDAFRTQQLFATITVYLGWMVAAYMGAVLPALNWEYHRRRSPVPPGQRSLLGDSRKLGYRIVAWLGALLFVTVVALWFVG